MKPIGIHSKDFGCCPGHDKVPYNVSDETNRGRRSRKVGRKKRLTRYWKRSFKNETRSTQMVEGID
jgi:ribosomal protein S15P/S13E